MAVGYLSSIVHRPSSIVHRPSSIVHRPSSIKKGITKMLALRPYTPLRMVLTVCGKCFSEDPDRKVDYEKDILQGNLVLMDGKVYLLRHCRRGHGEVISLYEEDYELWSYLQQWRVPTKQI